MVSEYDIFYIIARKGTCTISNINKYLGERKSSYNSIYNHISELKKNKLISKKNKTFQVINSKKSQDLYNIIHFCIKNNLSYNFLLKESVINFILDIAPREYFYSNSTDISQKTFTDYTNTLAKYGFVLIFSKKPLKAKLLENNFLKNLLKYHKKDNTFDQTKRQDIIPLIKKELSKYKKIKKQDNIDLFKLEEKSQISFIHQSLSLEGNPLTLPDTQKILTGQSISNYTANNIQELMNYKKAVDLMLENANNNKTITKELILIYHKTAMYHTFGAGEIRKHDVRIKGNPNFKTAAWQQISQKLDHLLTLYDEFKKEKNKTSNDLKRIISFAAFFHNEFQRIHPFNDGNSRTSRLLMFHILRNHKIPILDFPLGYFDQYLNLTKKSNERNDLEFEYLIQELILMDLKKLNYQI